MNSRWIVVKGMELVVQKIFTSDELDAWLGRQKKYLGFKFLKTMQSWDFIDISECTRHWAPEIPEDGEYEFHSR